MLLDAHVRPREQRSGKADEGGQCDQEYIELVDEELFVERHLRSRSRSRAWSRSPKRRTCRRLIIELSSAAHLREPNTASSTPPESGCKQQRHELQRSIILELLHMGDVQAVEGFADLEEENTENEGGHQHVQRDAQFHHQRHALRGAGGGEE